jgi:hypothetical protein
LQDLKEDEIDHITKNDIKLFEEFESIKMLSSPRFS